MNSLMKTVKVMGTVLIISFFTIIFLFSTGIQNAGAQSKDPIYERLTPEQQGYQRRVAKRAAMSAATGVLKKTRVWKRLDVIQKDIREKYSFEFKKRFADDIDNSGDLETTSDKKEVSSGEVVFSGKLGPNLSPTLSLSSGFKAADIAVNFDVFDHELDCEISSRPMNRLMGGKTVLGVSSDGGKSEAILKIAFEF